MYIHINGKEYLSSKDACVVSGYSERELLKMCKEKHIFFRKVKGGLFLHKESLMMHINTKAKEGEKHPSLDRAIFFAEEVIAHEKKLFLKNRATALAAVCLLLIVLVVPILFSKTSHVSMGGNLSLVSSAFTSFDFFH